MKLLHVCAAACGALLALVSASARADELSSVAVVQIGGQAPGDLLPISKGVNGGGPGVPSVSISQAASGLLFPGQLGARGLVDVEPGRVHLAGTSVLVDAGKGSVGNVSVDVLGSTRDTITVQGTPAQMGQHMKLNGALTFISNLQANATGRASANFPNPPVATGFADADSSIVFSLASTGIAGGTATLAQARRGIDNEHGLAFDIDTDPSSPTSVPFSMDLVVGKPTEISFIAQILATGSLSDLTGTPFGDDGDIARSEATFFGEVHWSSDTAFLTDATSGRVVHGLTLTSASGFDWLGSGQGPAAVPEPASWALMIMGFGGAGAALRSRRRLLPA